MGLLESKNRWHRATTMFVRFRPSARRLQVSLVETTRSSGKVTHGHVAGLGSINVSPSPADRIEFWMKLHQRLATLANRIDDETRNKIFAAIHAKIPLPTLDDQLAVQADNAKSDVEFWETLHDLQVSEIEDHKAALAALQLSIADREPRAANAAAKASAAQERVDRIAKGEAVGRLGKPSTLKDLLAGIGWKPSDVRHAVRLAELGESDGGWAELMGEINKRQRRSEKAATRAILAKRRSA
jgi:hypothetical protein